MLHLHQATLPPPAGTPEFPRVVDNVMLSSWRRCPHQFWRRHCQGLIPATAAGRLNFHLHFGACFAKGTEAARAAWVRGKPQPDCILAGLEAIALSWGDVPWEDPTPSISHKKSFPTCLLALQDYFRRWPLGMDEHRIVTIDGRPGVEWAGAHELPGTQHPYHTEQDEQGVTRLVPIVYAGRFDCIMQAEGKLWGLDDKTASRLGDWWRRKWKLRGQFSGYCWLASHYGLGINGFLVRGIAPLTYETNLEEVISIRPPHLISRWLEQTVSDVNRMSAQWHAMDWPRVFDDECGSCYFADMCGHRDPDSLTDEFVVERWDPLHSIEGPSE